MSRTPAVWATPITRVRDDASDRTTTEATCVMDTVDGASTITTMKLVTRGKVAGIDQAAFQQAAEGAKANCPVSRALKIANIELTATLEA